MEEPQAGSVGMAALLVAVPLVELLMALGTVPLQLLVQRVLAGAVVETVAEARHLAAAELAAALVTSAMGTRPSCSWVAAASMASSWAGTSAASWVASSMVSLAVPLLGPQLEAGQEQVEVVEVEVLAVLGVGLVAAGEGLWQLSSATTLPVTRLRKAAYVDDKADKADRADRAD